MTSADNPESGFGHIRPEDFASGPFKVHGDFDLVASGRILRTNAAGPFNEELTLAADKARRLVFPRYADDKPFAVITTVRESVMCPRAALDLFARQLKALRADGIPLPAAVVWVIADEVEGKSVMAPLYALAFAEAGITFRVMATADEAEQWVAAVFAEAPPDR